MIFIFFKNADEYTDLPVRHNEDQMNSELAKHLPIEVNPHSFDSSHTKTHLLLQAHFSHAMLPCPDYATDTKTVLDQAIRICQVLWCISVCNLLVYCLLLECCHILNIEQSEDFLQSCRELVPHGIIVPCLGRNWMPIMVPILQNWQ